MFTNSYMLLVAAAILYPWHRIVKSHDSVNPWRKSSDLYIALYLHEPHITTWQTNRVCCSGISNVLLCFKTVHCRHDVLCRIHVSVCFRHPLLPHRHAYGHQSGQVQSPRKKPETNHTWFILALRAKPARNDRHLHINVSYQMVQSYIVLWHFGVGGRW